MTERSTRVFDLAAALSDGSSVDWDAAESMAASDSERRQIRQLKLVRALAIAQVRESFGPGAPGVHESLLHPSAAGAPVDHPAPVTWGPLQVIEKIGRGKFGDVYRAFDPRLDREVALKLLRRRASARDGVASHVIEEGRLLAKVRHPNVVTVYGAERIDDRVGVWMELVSGRTLEEELTSRGPLPADEVAGLGMDVCRALGAVHRAGLLHRDVKAQNVMRDEEGRTVLMDFGTGSELDAASPAELAGTPLYLAPEVLDGTPATPQSDIYSVGVLLYHLATGTFPIRARTLAGIRAAHARGERAIASSAAGQLPPRLERVVERALAHDPLERYATAAEMDAALESSGRDRSGAVPAPAGRLMPRHFGTIAAVLAAAVIALVLGTGSGWRRFLPAETAPAASQGQPSVRRIWSGAGVDASGPSPDGRYLTFTDWETGDLAVHDFTTNSNRRLTQTGGWVPSGDYAAGSVFSRDGRQLAVAWFIDTPPAFEFRIVPLDSTDGSLPARTLVRTLVNEYIGPVGWTSDGASIIVIRNTTQTTEIGRLVVADGSYRTIIRLEWRRPTSNGVSLSPDGRFIAYDSPAGEKGSPHDIYAVGIDGGAPVPVVQSVAQDQSPLWSPDGSQLLFLSDRTGTLSLWGQPMRNGEPAGAPSLLKADMGGGKPVGVTTKGALYYLMSGTARQNVYVADVAGAGSALTPSVVSDRFVNSNIGPAWSNDGERLAYYSKRPAPTLVVRTTRSGVERDYPLPPTLAIPFHQGPKWFPDNDSVLIMTREKLSLPAFRRLHLSSGRVEELFRPTHGNLSSYALAPDGSAIYWTHQQTGVSELANGQLVRFDLATKRETILQKDHSFISVAISPDGRELAYVESDRPAEKSASRSFIAVMPARGGPAREIFSDPRWISGHRYNSLGWASDGRSVMFVGEDGALWSVPAAGGTAEKMGLSMTARIKTPVFRPDGKALAFGSVDADTNEVWALENFLPAPAAAHVEASPAPLPQTAAAMSLQQVWAGAGANIEGQPSADGRTLVYVDWASNGNVGIRDLASGTSRLLTRDGDYRNGANAGSPIFSPDGQFVAYTWLENLSSLRIVGVDGSPPRTVFRRERMVPYPVGWTADGKQLAVFVRDLRDRTASFALISADGERVATIRELGSRDVEVGGFSPDSQWALYSIPHGANDKNGGIFVLRLRDRTERALVQTPDRNSSPRWTPDGRAIVFLSDRTGTTDLWMARVTDGRADDAPELLRRSVGDIIPMGFARDGTYFYGARNVQSDAYVAQLDPSTLTVTAPPRRLTDRFQGSNHGPAWSPDGKLVAFVRGERAASTIVVHSMDGSERALPTKVVDGIAASRHGLNWFPDSKFVLLQDWVDKKKPFRKVNVETGEAQTILEPDENTWFAIRLSPDGRYVYYSVWDNSHAVNERAPLRLYRREIATGRTDKLYEMRSDGIGFFGLCVSPDGRTLAFSANDAPGVRLLMTLPSAGGEPRVLFRGAHQNLVPAPMTWTRDGKHLLYAAVESKDGEPRREAVWAIPSQGGTPRRVGLTMPGFLSFTLSPDGRQLAFQSGQQAHEVWAIRNLLTGARPSRR